ncbi:MAG: hypothetical protein JKX85_08195 [Phycisphaeraceae bacterium]|nr:hypothetical protein [Phycisphaeraceae bacterium]
MNRFLLNYAVWLIFPFAITCTTLAGSSGYVVSRGGNSVQFIRSSDSKIEIFTQNSRAFFGLDELASIVVGDKTTLFKFRNGRVIEGSFSFDRRNAYNLFHYVKFNLLTGTQEPSYISADQIGKIQFTGDVGPYRKCARENKLLPYIYEFCPYCGDRAIWAPAEGTPQGLSVNEARACEKCGFITHTGLHKCPTCNIELKSPKTDISRKTFDYLLGRAGVDPSSKEAAAAKNLARKILNPFTTEDEMIQAIKEAAKTATDK